MVSRRNIRVKVMQTLYALESRGETGSLQEAVRLLEQQFAQGHRLLIYIIYCLTDVALYAEKDARARAAKHLPTREDLEVSTKISGNEVVARILGQPSFIQALKKEKPELIHDPDLTRKLYLRLFSSQPYQDYISRPGRSAQEEKDILDFIFTDLMLPGEEFTGHVEEQFTNWDDDAEMLAQLVSGALARPGGFPFQAYISQDKWTFARQLLETAIGKKELALDYIRPKLRNWDVERIAQLDMLLMRLGVCEFLFFETIPPKVTINEYIDLAKDYSTPQSGQFVNGILDSVHKDLLKEDKLQKIAFKQS